MAQKIKTQDALNVYRIISTAKYAKLDDADKIKVWKIARALKPIAVQFEEDSKDAAEKLKPTEDFNERLKSAQEYEMAVKDQNFDASTLKMGASEYQTFLKEFQNYNKLVQDAVKEFADKENKINFEKLSEEAFGKLMASNEWTMEQTMTLGDIVCELNK